VPTLLRAAGLHVHTLAEVYGIPADEKVADVEWLARAGTEGWAVLLEDTQVFRSYKVRGAYSLIARLPEDARAKGVVCASVGNDAPGDACSVPRSWSSSWRGWPATSTARA
jgi:hypothetical protein